MNNGPQCFGALTEQGGGCCQAWVGGGGLVALIPAQKVDQLRAVNRALLSVV